MLSELKSSVGMKSISRLSVKELSRHLRVFMKNLPMHEQTLEIDLNTIEQFSKQYQAFSWAVEVEEKLDAYTKEMSKLIRKMRSPISDAISVLHFMDLPRPPVFVVKGDIQTSFKELVSQIKSSNNYSPLIGVDLGIEGLDG